MDKRKVDLSLTELCRTIVQVLDHPEELSHYSAEDRELIEWPVKNPSFDLLQNEEYYGGLDKDGVYRFGLFGNRTKRGYEIFADDRYKS